VFIDPIGIEVDVEGNAVTFTFASPISILTAVVSQTSGDHVVWQIIAEEFQPISEQGWEVSSSRVWPAEEAPPQIVELLQATARRTQKELDVRGPRKPLTRMLRCGQAPPGYRSEVPFAGFQPGSYNAIIFAEQGHATATFEITAVA